MYMASNNLQIILSSPSYSGQFTSPVASLLGRCGSVKYNQWSKEVMDSWLIQLKVSYQGS